MIHNNIILSLFFLGGGVCCITHQSPKLDPYLNSFYQENQLKIYFYIFRKFFFYIKVSFFPKYPNGKKMAINLTYFKNFKSMCYAKTVFHLKFRFIVFNATFNNISATCILWCSLFHLMIALYTLSAKQKQTAHYSFK